MANSYGKEWETKVKEDFQKIDGSSIDRIYDTTNGYKNINNISDFIAYLYPCIYYLEAKSCRGNTFPLTNLTQYAKLSEKVGIPGVRVGILLWMIDHDVCLYVPISTITKLKQDGKKSVNIKMIQEGTYNIKVVPSIKKRVFLDCDYNILRDLKDGE